jgi:hypothetical protein
MAETIEKSALYRLRYTPIRDFLRGNISARMDLRRNLRDSALPPVIQRVVERVVKSTRLWRLERLEVQKELCAHFSDGLAAGISPEELVKKFGDESQTARLIRRAKRRNRPLLWHGLRFAFWSAVVFVSLYGTYAVYFFSSRPSPRIDYVAVINARVEKTPVEDRAWPSYRRALLGLGEVMNKPLASRDPSWLTQFVKDHQKELELIREGAAKPEFGFLFGAKGIIDNRELWPKREIPVVDPKAGEALSEAEIPSLLALRNLGAFLSADAALAREAHDGKRLLRDVTSMIRLARQVGKRGPVLLSLISLSLHHMALDQIDLTLRSDPFLGSGEDWKVLLQRLSEPRVTSDVIALEIESLEFQDRLQRYFTDDGSGDGRLTARGFQVLFHAEQDGKRLWADQFLDPGSAFMMASVNSRKDLNELYTRSLSRAEENFKLPLRNANWPASEDEKSNSWKDKFVQRPYVSFQSAAERYLGKRDGIVIGIALELYRREHGEYPGTLEALSPKLLAGIPADRITGEPLHYRLKEGRPLVYSVGVDRDDDAGRVPAEAPLAAAPYAPGTVVDGDWALYPSAESLP